jgi:hypothetical protein
LVILIYVETKNRITMLVCSIGSMSVLLTPMGFLKLTPLPIVK